MTLHDQSRFPRSSQYAADWQTHKAYGANSLWLAEWLCEELSLQPAMKVLDLGCGRAKSSVFLAKEFGVEVWAGDIWNSAEENQARVNELDVGDTVTCVFAEATRLPFEFGFFDAIVAFDSIQYYGTDCLFLPYVLQFLRPGGTLAFASASIMQPIQHPVPEHLTRFWAPDVWCLRTIEWWQDHWQRTGLVDIQTADRMDDGWRYWHSWGEQVGFADWYLETLEKDAGECLGYIRMVATRSEASRDLTHDLRTGKLKT